MAKALLNSDTGEFMGYAVFQVKKTLFDKAFTGNQEGYAINRSLIIDRNPDTQNTEELGALLYFNGDEAAKADVLAHYLADEPGHYLFSHSQNIVSGWEIANVIEKSELSQESTYTGCITVLVHPGMLFFCMRASSGISSLITKPLALLEKTIRGVDKGQFRVNEEFDDSEIGRIGN